MMEKNNCLQCSAGFYAPEASVECLPCGEGTISVPGASSCEPCGTGTVASPLKNSCKATCVFTDPSTGYVYDLTSLNKNGTITVIPSNNNEVVSYEISLCNKFVPEDCSTCTENSYIFGEFGDETPRVPRSLGTWFEFQPVNQTSAAISTFDVQPDVPSHTFDIIYTRGTNLPLSCTQVSTTIKFFCTPTEGQGLPVATTLEEGKCTAIFEWSSLYACRTCTVEDEVQEEGPCVGGKRKVSTKYKVPCYEKEVKEPTDKPCEDIEVARTTLIVAIVMSAVLLGVGVGAAIYFFNEKRQIEAKYELLRNEVNVDENTDEIL